MPDHIDNQADYEAYCSDMEELYKLQLAEQAALDREMAEWVDQQSA